MRFGLGPHAVDQEPSGLEALVASAEEAGFDSIWLAEDGSRAGAGGGLATAAFLAQRTCLAIGVVVELGRRHPLRLAEEAAVADLCCGGRLELGVRPRGPAAAEELGLLLAALSGRPLRWRGEAFQVPAELPPNGPVPGSLAVNPRPLQARLPVWLFGGDEPLRALAIQLGCGVVAAWEERERPAPGPAALPSGLLCPGDADLRSTARAIEQAATYLLIDVAAETALSVSRRLLPPLRMPELPGWVDAGGSGGVD